MKFSFTTAGESNGKALVAIIEGMPSGVEIDVEKLDLELWRRQQGYGRGGRMKIEQDTVEILSGVRHGKTLGSPISVMITNRDFVHWEKIMASEAVDEELKNPRTVTRPRPGHADLAGGQKFQTRDLRNVLERASARETAARVACGGFAKQLHSRCDRRLAWRAGALLLRRQSGSVAPCGGHPVRQRRGLRDPPPAAAALAGRVGLRQPLP